MPVPRCRQRLRRPPSPNPELRPTSSKRQRAVRRPQEEVARTTDSGSETPTDAAGTADNDAAAPTEAGQTAGSDTEAPTDIALTTDDDAATRAGAPATSPRQRTTMPRLGRRSGKLPIPAPKLRPTSPSRRTTAPQPGTRRRASPARQAPPNRRILVPGMHRMTVKQPAPTPRNRSRRTPNGRQTPLRPAMGNRRPPSNRLLRPARTTS